MTPVLRRFLRCRQVGARGALFIQRQSHLVLCHALRDDASQRQVHNYEPLYAAGSQVPEVHKVYLGHSPLSLSGKREVIPDRRNMHGRRRHFGHRGERPESWGT